jgi:hypothetical protein
MKQFLLIVLVIVLSPLIVACLIVTSLFFAGVIYTDGQKRF